VIEVKRRGRRSDLEEEILLRKLSKLQEEKGGVLTFSEIHKMFVSEKIISNTKYRGNTRRILRRLMEKGYLEQMDRGKYRLKVSPKPFQVTELINEVREKYGDSMIYEWRVGGHLWSLAEGVVFGLSPEIEDNPVYKLVLEVLLIRLAAIFDAIVQLSIAARISKDPKKAPIPRTAVREFALNTLPHFIGERSGIDGDGLPAEDIIELYKLVVKNLPKYINVQPIQVDTIKEYIHISEKMLKKSIDVSGMIEDMIITSGESKETWRKIRELEKIVLVMYPPRHLIDEKEEERELYELLKMSIEEGNNNATLLAHMKVYDENVVGNVMKYLDSAINKKRKIDLMSRYKLVRAGMILGSVVTTYLSAKHEFRKPRHITHEEDAFSEVIEIDDFADNSMEDIVLKLREELNNARRHGYTLEEMIKGIWLSAWPLNAVPRFVILYHQTSENTIELVREAVRETLEAMNVRPPRNFDSLVREGYKLVKELDELLKRDSQKY